MNRHVKEFLIDALLFSIPAVFISFAFISIYARTFVNPRSGSGMFTRRTPPGPHFFILVSKLAIRSRSFLRPFGYRVPMHFNPERAGVDWTRRYERF
jgi:hypothetical protein